jgi:hypothetical protein
MSTVKRRLRDAGLIQPGFEPRTVVTPLALRCSALDRFATQVPLAQIYCLLISKQLELFSCQTQVECPSRDSQPKKPHIYIYGPSKVFTPFCIFPILLPYNLALKWILGGFLSFDLHNIPTTLKMQNIFCCFEQTRNKTKKQNSYARSSFHPPKVNTL